MRLLYTHGGACLFLGWMQRRIKSSRAVDEGMARIANMPPDQQRNYMFSRVLIRDNVGLLIATQPSRAYQPRLPLTKLQASSPGCLQIGTEKHRLEEADALVLTEATLCDNLRRWDLYLDFMRNMRRLPSLLVKRKRSFKKAEAELTDIRNRIRLEHRERGQLQGEAFLLGQ